MCPTADSHANRRFRRMIVAFVQHHRRSHTAHHSYQSIAYARQHCLMPNDECPMDHSHTIESMLWATDTFWSLHVRVLQDGKENNYIKQNILIS